MDQAILNLKQRKKIMGRIISPCSLLIILLALSFFHFRYNETKKHYFVAEFVTDQVGATQLFWDIGSGFNQKDSQALAIQQVHNHIHHQFTLPSEPIQNLRFDPHDKPARLVLKRLAIEKGNGEIVENIFQSKRLKPAPNTSISDNGVALIIDSTDNDPIMVLDIDYDSLQIEINSSSSFVSFTYYVILPSILVFIAYAVFGNIVTPLLFSYLVWSIFAPGILSPDSIDQYGQAISFSFLNWHPPIIAIILHYLLKLHIPIGWILLTQAALGFTGTYFLFKSITLLFRDKLPEKAFSIAVFVLFSCLVLPVSTYAPFMCTLWKDVWFTISLIWILSILIQINTTTSKPNIFRIAGLTALMVVSILLRHNAILLLPIYAILLWISSKGCGLMTKGITIVSLATLSLFSNTLINNLYEVKTLAPKQSIMGLEIVGLIVLKPELKAEFPYTTSQLKDNYLEKFQWAGYDLQRWGEDPYMKPDFVRSDANLPLQHEYSYALKHHLPLLLKVKILNFLKLIDPTHTERWCPSGITENDYGIIQNHLLKPLRDIYYKYSDITYHSKYLRFISAVHLPWMILSLVFLMISIVRILRHQKQIYYVQALLLMVPVTYTFSYLAAIPWTSFRYIYPATLVIQILTFTLVFVHSIRLFESTPQKATIEPAKKA